MSVDACRGTLLETRAAQPGADGAAAATAALAPRGGAAFKLDRCAVPVRTCKVSAATGELSELLPLLKASV